MGHLLFLELFHQLRRLQIQILRLLENPTEFQRHPPLQLGLVWIILRRIGDNGRARGVSTAWDVWHDGKTGDIFLRKMVVTFVSRQITCIAPKSSVGSLVCKSSTTASYILSSNAITMSCFCTSLVGVSCHRWGASCAPYPNDARRGVEKKTNPTFDDRTPGGERGAIVVAIGK
jgi:hypothetical protein